MSDEDVSTSILIVGGCQRRRGRPRVDQPRSSVSTWVWARHHDALIRIAAKKEVSVSALVREILTKALPETKL